MKAYLIFEDGEVFEGERIGPDVDVVAQLVPFGQMGGYMEAVTDPANFGQILLCTFPMIGGYGAISSDVQSNRVCVSAVVVRDLCDTGSNFRKDGEFGKFLTDNAVVVLKGIDTRAVQRKIRETGTMGAVITSSREGFSVKTRAAKAYSVQGAVESMSTKEVVTYGEGRRVVLWDLGCKNSTIDALTSRGCEVVRVPYSTSAKDILARSPSGVVIAGGGGDPLDYADIAAQIKELFDANIPMFGIGMGLMLMALAKGANIKRLPHSHHGCHPVRDIHSGRIYSTAQSHSFSVVTQSLDKDKMSVSFVNMGDKTCEGLDFLGCSAFGVAFSPEGASGPKETEFLYDRFIETMNKITQNNEESCKNTAEGEVSNA